MADWKKQARTTVAGLVMAGMVSGVAFGYPDEKETPKGDLGAVLEKVPPEVREKVKAEFEKIRAEAEKVRAQALAGQKQAREAMMQIEREAKNQAERIQRDAKEQIERIQNEVRRQMEGRERERNADREAQANKARQEADRPRAEGQPRQEIRREMRVEVRKEGDGEPKVQVFENGKPLPPEAAAMHGRLNFQFALPHEVDLSKLPPEKREVIEKARKEFKEAEARLREAGEKLAKAQGTEQPKVMIFRAEGPDGVVIQGQPFDLRGVPMGDRRPGMLLPPLTGGMSGDRLPGMQLPPGAVIMGDRLPRPPVPPTGPANPELEKRVSKAEKALDDILNELKKLREEGEKEDDEDEEDEKEAKQKPNKRKKG